MAIASTVVHIGLALWWLLARGASPSTPASTPPIERPEIRVAFARVFPAPETPEAPPPVDEPAATTTPRFTWLTVNRARPDVVMAWSDREVAYSDDDGRTFHVVALPWISGDRTTWGRNGVVTSSGDGLIDLDRRAWWRIPRGPRVGDAPIPAGAVETAHLPGSVRVWASDARRTLAVVQDEEGAERFFISTDDARTFEEGPRPPREVYDLAIRPRGRVVAAWAWSASCGGGGEGDASWTTGDSAWTERSRATIAPPAADDWLYVAQHHVAVRGSLVTGIGPDDAIALGPAVPAGERTWVATDGRATYVGVASVVLSARRGVFTLHDEAAPEGLREVSIDGRGRLVGLTNSGITRRDAAGSWRTLRPPQLAPAGSPDAVSGPRAAPAPPR